MISKISKILIMTALAAIAASLAIAGQNSFPVWSDFYGDASLYNGQPLPVGSIVEAYDSQGTLCGTFVVKVQGKYGLLGAFGDDADTPEDEGAVIGETISFKINGRDATPLGPDDPIWQGMGSIKNVNLSANALVGIEEVEFPTDQYSGPGETVHYTVVFRNTGEGTDFYSIEGTSSNSWIVNPQTDPVYVGSMEVGSIGIDVVVPPLAPNNITDILSFTVHSGVDPTVTLSGSVNTLVVTSAVPGDDDPLIPQAFSLHQNYPNPFNPMTTISFDLPQRSETTLEVFNLLGQSVDKFDLGVLSAGRNSFTYNAGNMPSGVYFYSVTAGNNKATMKMVLLK